MNVKRYFGTTAREALRALKAELGGDAIVLSNRAVDGGVEILALPAEAVGVIQAHAESATDSSPRPKPAAQIPTGAMRSGADSSCDEDDFRVSLSDRSHHSQRATTAPIRPVAAPRVKVADGMATGFTASGSQARAAGLPRAPGLLHAPGLLRNGEWDDLAFGMPAGVGRSAPFGARDHASGLLESTRTTQRGADLVGEKAREKALEEASDARVRELQDANARLMDELAGIRGLIERQLAGFAWGEAQRNAPARAQIVGELLEAGFSGSMARKLAEAVGDDATLENARGVVKNLLARDMRAMSSDADLIDRGGVYALVGPTGVGKTTTTAKLAARCVVRHGAEKLALITTDGYRIGAQEQLRIYGRILGVPVFPVRDAAELRQTLSELRNKHMVLIDTVGMSQRDRMVAHQAAMLTGAGSVRRLLLLNATCRGDTLDDVIAAYRGPDLAGCILTKVDEAASLAPVIGTAIAHELEVFYVTNGQRVPEDLHLPNRAYLLHRALRTRDADSAWKLQGDEAALMMAAAGAEH